MPCAPCVAESCVDCAGFGRTKEDWLRTLPPLPNGIPGQTKVNEKSDAPPLALAFYPNQWRLNEYFSNQRVQYYGNLH